MLGSKKQPPEFGGCFLVFQFVLVSQKRSEKVWNEEFANTKDPFQQAVPYKDGRALLDERVVETSMVDEHRYTNGEYKDQN